MFLTRRKGTCWVVEWWKAGPLIHNRIAHKCFTCNICGIFFLFEPVANNSWIVHTMVGRVVRGISIYRDLKANSNLREPPAAEL